MPESPTVRRRMLASELRKLRAAAGRTVIEVAEYLGCSQPKISRIETAQRAATITDVRAMAAFYGVTDPDAVEHLVRLARDARKRGWWASYAGRALPPWFETYVGLEAEAQAMSTYEIDIVPGVLQTVGYARALYRATVLAADDPSIEQRVELRMQRAARLHDDPPLHVWAVVGEGALWRQVGGPAVFAEQLEHLAKLTEQPNVTVQVMPFSVGEHPATGAFVLLRFPAPRGADVVYLENPVGGYYLEAPADVLEYTAVLDHLRAHALDPAHSVRLIRGRAREVQERGQQQGDQDR